MEKTLEQILQNALNHLNQYPESLEELGVQLNLITEACEKEATKFDFEYIEGTHTTEEI